MARGPKKHLKRLNAPSHWYLSKLGGNYAPRPSQGPHKLRECLPMVILLRNRLKYALTYEEAKKIAFQRVVKVDNRVRTDTRFPIGFMDVVRLDRTDETFRMLYDTKGRFVAHRVGAEEGQYKLCRVKKAWRSVRNVPTVSTHDGRTISFMRPDLAVHDVVRVDLATGKVLDTLKFDIGVRVMITGGKNIGRVGQVVTRERHPGSYEIVHVTDARGKSFATRASNVFAIGTEANLWVTLPKDAGIRKTIIEDRTDRLKAAAK